ncbi:MAG: hypothetical protein MH137_11270 [Flavobacteriales bacterium]|nr:hypothetical protein [Flavobacteriales bacterium]
MYTTIQIEISPRRSLINIKGTPDEIAQALLQTAKQNDTLNSALAIISGALRKDITECKCGRLSQSECQMICISEFPSKKQSNPQQEYRLLDGVDDGAYAED